MLTKSKVKLDKKNLKDGRKKSPSLMTQAEVIIYLYIGEARGWSVLQNEDFSLRCTLMAIV